MILYMKLVRHLKEQLKRLEKIKKYHEKAKHAKKEKDKEYYEKYASLLFDPGETFDNYEQVTQEYQEALDTKENTIKQLYLEIEIIKSLRKQNKQSVIIKS